MHDRPTIRALREQGLGVREVARLMPASRNAVRRALAPGARDTYRRRSELDVVEPAVRALLTEYPAMPVPSIAARIGWRRSTRHLSTLVRRIRSEYGAQTEGVTPGRALAVGRPATGRLTAGTATAAATIEVGRVR